MILTDKQLFENIREVIARGPIPIPTTKGYGGAGGPGKLLEELLGISGGNWDTPDAGKWEIKFHSGSAPITLFHKEAEPSGYMKKLVSKFGILDEKGRLRFRHTIYNTSPRGFYVVNASEKIIVKRDSLHSGEWPYWSHDTLINAFIAKLRRVLVMPGKNAP